MKKAKTEFLKVEEADMLPEYDFRGKKGVRSLIALIPVKSAKRKAVTKSRQL